MIKLRQTDGKVAEVEGQLFTGILDMNGTEIFVGDTVRFTDKWEWWRCQFGGGWLATQADYEEVLSNDEKYPYEDRIITFPDSYEWLMSGEIQTRWEIVK